MGKKWRLASVAVKIALLAGAVALSFVLFKVYKETLKKKQIQATIDELQREADELDRDNRKMKENLEFLSSVDYLEIEAKDKLNRKNPDEEVIVLKNNAVQKKEDDEPEQINRTDEEKVAVANHLKWWNYFFKY